MALYYVKNMTDKNMHCEARVFVAEKILKDPVLTDWYKAMLAVRDRQGYLTQAQSSSQYRLDSECLWPALRNAGLGCYYQAL